MDLVFPMKKITLIILIISLITITAGCSNKGAEADVEEVDLSQELKVIEAFGLVKSQETKNIIIDFPASVKEVFVKEGQLIGLGDPIMTLDLSEYLSKVASKENEIMISKIEQQKIEKNLQGLYRENRELEIEKLTNDLNFAKEVHHQYANEFHAHQKLFEAGAISQQEFDKMKREVEEKKKLVDDLHYKLLEVNHRKEREIEELLLKKGAEGDQLRIQRERALQAENELAIMKNRLDKAYLQENQIVCDLDKAVVSDILYRAGDIVDPTLKAFSIAGLNDLVVEADVVEDFIKDVEIGASVSILPVADKSRDYKGKVIYISNMAFEKNGETVIPVRISVKNIDHFLMPNFNVDVFIDSK